MSTLFPRNRTSPWGLPSEAQELEYEGENCPLIDPQGIHLMELSDTNYIITVLNIVEELKHKIGTLAENI